MNIDLLSKMVKEQILESDSVIIPGLGTFIAEFIPATFSDKGYTINPPYRRLAFRQKEEGDINIVDLYASSNNISQKQATRILSDYIRELRIVLESQKTLVFPELGRLRATKENNFFFVPDEDIDIYPEGFALEPISLKSHQETEDEISDTISDLKTILVEEEEEECDLSLSKPAEEEENQEATDLDKLDHRVEDKLDLCEEVEEDSEERRLIPSKPVEEEDERRLSPSKPIEEDNNKPKSRTWLWIVLIVLISLIILVAVFIFILNFYPELIDKILYTKEELDIINYKL